MAKCKGGFRFGEYVKGKGFWRSRKEEVLLNDFFARVFEVEVEKRISVGGLREHGLLRCKGGEEESTEEEASSELAVAVEWEINQIRFVQKIARQVESCGFLSPFLLLAFKFYINKVILFLLQKDLLKNYRRDKDGHPKLLKMLAEMESDVLAKL